MLCYEHSRVVDDDNSNKYCIATHIFEEKKRERFVSCLTSAENI